MRVRVAAIAAACVVVLGTVAWAGNTFEGFQIVRVMVGGQEVVTEDVPAVNFYGRTMLPVRKLAEVAGLTVEKWDAETNTVYLSSPQTGLSKAAATVNGEAISERELYERLAKANGGRLLDDMIMEVLVDQAARQAGVTVTPAEIDQEIARIKASVGGEAQFAAALQQNNLTLDQLRQNQIFRLKVTRLITPSIPTGDDLLKAFFADNPGRFDSRQVQARHILVATEAEAKEIKAQLDKGAAFGDLAKAKSIDPSAQSNAGDLGTFGVGMMVPEFEQVVFGMEAGQISAPFKSQFGWHVAQVVSVTGTAPDFEAGKAEVKAAYIEAQVQQRAQAWLMDLRAKAEIQK